MQYEGKHFKREYKHLKVEPKKQRRRRKKSQRTGRGPSRLLLTVLIAVELVLTAAASCAVFMISWDHIYTRRTALVTAELSQFEPQILKKGMKKMVKKAREQVAEKRDEQVWTTESVNYRVGPDGDYDSAGSLDIYSGVKRTGVTYNDWSQVEIGDASYYIKSEYLTTEAPIITATGQKGEYQKYALMMLPNYGWEETEMYPLIKLWDRESGWNPAAHNRGSGAHGIPQALPASKMSSEGSDYYSNGNTQIRWGLNYIKSRYGSPSNAWAHWTSHGWY